MESNYRLTTKGIGAKVEFKIRKPFQPLTPLDRADCALMTKINGHWDREAGGRNEITNQNTSPERCSRLHMNRRLDPILFSDND
jgi:hypothetical protein